MKNKTKLIILIIFLCFCFFIFYKGLDNSNIYMPNIKNQKDIPIFKAKDFNSNIYINSEEVFEKNVFYIVNIWASWCIPCKKEHPFLMELKKDQSIELIGLNYKDNLNNAKNFINEFGNPYNQILIDKNGLVGIEFGAYGVPETFVINKNKMVIERFIGPINQEILDKIKSIIK